MKIVNTRKMAITAKVNFRRKQVAKLLLEGLTYQKIADKVDIKSKKTIHDDVHAIFALWRSECLRDVDKAFLVELDRLHFVLNEAQEHWELSKKAKRVKRTKRVVPGKDGKEEIVETSVETMKLQPDKNYLELIVRTSERLCKMLGLDAVQEIKLSGKIERTDEYKIVLEAREGRTIEQRREVMRLLAEPKSDNNTPLQTDKSDGEQKGTDPDSLFRNVGSSKHQRLPED